MQRLLRDDIEVEHETWLVDLHPFGAAAGQFAQHLDVNRQQPVEQRQRIEIGVLAFCQFEKRNRTDQHRAGLISQRPGFLIFFDWLARGEGELLIRRQFRHHEVVVGVEPFCHFLRRYAVRGVVPMMGVAASYLMRFALGTAGHRKIGRERDRAAVPAIDFRYRADHHRCVEHLVVEREIVRRDHADAEFLLARPVGGAKTGAGFDQRLLVGCAGPETFQCEFQLAARADPWRTEGGNGKRGRGDYGRRRCSRHWLNPKSWGQRPK